MKVGRAMEKRQYELNKRIFDYNTKSDLEKYAIKIENERKQNELNKLVEPKQEDSI